MENRAGLVGSAVGVCIVVLVVGLTLTAVPEIGRAELGVDRFLMAHVPPTGTAVAAGIGAVLEPAGGVVLLALVAALVWLRADLVRAVRFGVVASGSWLSVEVAKVVVHRPRPVLPGVDVTHESWSYPSGHVALVTAVVAGLVVVTVARARVQVLAVGSVVVVVVAVSRLTLGVHHPSDVAAAVVWTAAVAVVVHEVLRAVERRTRTGSRLLRGDAPVGHRVRSADERRHRESASALTTQPMPAPHLHRDEEAGR